MGWGCSRSTKIYLACEPGRMPLSRIVTAGQRGDAPQFPAVMAGSRRARTRARATAAAYTAATNASPSTSWPS